MIFKLFKRKGIMTHINHLDTSLVEMSGIVNKPSELSIKLQVHFAIFANSKLVMCISFSGFFWEGGEAIFTILSNLLTLDKLVS